MNKVINIDLDGVLADFNGRMKELTGKTFEEFGVSKDAWDALSKRKDDIYLHLEVLDGARELIAVCEDIARTTDYKLSILTGIPKHNRIPNTEEHKRIWVQKHFPQLYSRFKLGPFSEDKWKHCYNEYDILIDDYHRNIAQWNAVNGRGVHHKHWELQKTIDRLYELVR
jgi:5'(3')-deoxyribonucleotidase